MSERVIEEFNGIKFLKAGISATITNPKDKTNLFKLFFCIINKNSLEVDQHNLQQLLNDDLKIDGNAINKRLLSVLEDALIYYIIRWPGWQRQNEYQNGTLKIQDWFARFQQYLIFKCKFIIKSAPEAYSNKSTQTDTINASEKQFAPYGLYIGAPPFVLNNIVFEERNGDILLRRCIEKTWKNPSVTELLNWPHICVSLKLPDISFSRSNVQQVERYMGLSGDIMNAPEVEHIAHIKKVPILENSDKCSLKSYSLEFFAYYIKQLNSVLKMIPEVAPVRLQELEIILKEFLCDVNEADIYDKTMCTYISVRYHIGKYAYMRNRKMIVTNENRISKNQNAINFYETIIPQVDLTLHYFNAEQDNSDVDNISFVSLNILEERLKSGQNTSEIDKLKNLINTACLVYTCTLCQKRMCGLDARIEMINHLQTTHRAEQSLLCYKCCKEYDVYSLAACRWGHNCGL